MSSPNELVYFTVQGHWYDVEAALTSGSVNTPQIEYVSAFVTFTPRLTPGTILYIANFDVSSLDSSGQGLTQANSGIALAPITARIFEGELQVINRADTAEVQLVANTPELSYVPASGGTGAPLSTLIYDVAFTQASYAGAAQKLLNFAFTAPTAAGTVDLCDPAFTRLPYDPTNYPS